MFKKIGLGLLIVLVLIVIVVARHLLMIAGLGQNLETQWLSECRTIETATGPEDFHFDPGTGLVFMTAEDRRGNTNDPTGASSGPKNGLYVLDASPENISDIKAPVSVLPEDFGGINPHGLYFWDDGAGDKRLFVVNHAPSGDENIEIFQIGDGGALTHLESIAFPEMFLPNDVVAVGPRQFYATNYLKHTKPPMAVAEILLGLPYTSVVYFDGETGRTVADGLGFANGINVSADLQKVYVAEFSKHQISVYDRASDNRLQNRTTIHVPMAPDNLDIDEDGNIWTAGHPKMFDFIDLIEDPTANAPSMGLVIDPEAKSVEQVFVSDGKEINASSVAAIAGDKLLIGSVYDSHLLICAKPEL